MSLGLWSIMTAFSGMARNFSQLLLARIGVGVGEAGGSPPAHAMISDYFPQEKRSTALSVYSAGIYIGILVGFLMGGYLNQHLGWRRAFFVLGIPGIFFSLFFFTTVKEPPRGATDTVSTDKTYSIGEVLRFLYSTKTFAYLTLATGLHVFCILRTARLGAVFSFQASWNEEFRYRCFSRINLWYWWCNRNFRWWVPYRLFWEKRQTLVPENSGLCYTAVNAFLQLELFFLTEHFFCTCSVWVVVLHFKVCTSVHLLPLLIVLFLLRCGTSPPLFYSS